MNDCCPTANPSTQAPNKYRCPINGREYPRVAITTILHHIKAPWQWPRKQQGYYFCDDPKCDVVYFAEDDSILDTQALRTQVGIKQDSPQATLCYCFGINREVATTDSAAKAFVVQQTKQKSCACAIRNPSGRCCLKDFPKT
jgi:hypothetical protein